MSLAQIKNNYCPVCFKDNLYGHFDHNKSQIEIFSCRHFTCKNCYQQMDHLNFSCPICRKEGDKYILSFSSPNFARWNTLSEWCIDFKMALLMNPNRKFERGFGKIYSDFIDEYNILKKKFKENVKKKKKIKKQQIKKKEKTKSRLNAVCKLCNTQCTSILQLKKHINSRNCKRKQKN